MLRSSDRSGSSARPSTTIEDNLLTNSDNVGLANAGERHHERLLLRSTSDLHLGLEALPTIRPCRARAT